MQANLFYRIEHFFIFETEPLEVDTPINLTQLRPMPMLTSRF